jgi:DNA-binding phage protein
VPLTRDFKETIMAEIRRRPGLRSVMLAGAVEELLAGDFAVAKDTLRDLINGTMGFEALSARIGIPPKSLMRMFGPSGNPQAKNLFAVIAALQKEVGIKLEVSAKVPAKRRGQSLKRSAERKPRAESRALYDDTASSKAQLGFAEESTRFKRR